VSNQGKRPPSLVLSVAASTRSTNTPVARNLRSNNLKSALILKSSLSRPDSFRLETSEKSFVVHGLCLKLLHKLLATRRIFARCQHARERSQDSCLIEATIRIGTGLCPVAPLVGHYNICTEMIQAPGRKLVVFINEVSPARAIQPTSPKKTPHAFRDKRIPVNSRRR
jgi:hypothetical protein